MEEKETQAVEAPETAAPADVKSFRCSATKADLRTFLIAFLTSAIVIALYHVGLMMYDMFCAEEAEPVYCVCHQNSASEEEEKPRKFEGKKFGGDRQISPEQRERFRARMERFKNLPPEVQEKVKNMSREERREFFQNLDAKRPPREGRREGRPDRPERRRGDAPRPREKAAE